MPATANTARHPVDAEMLSPELVLVDPELAARARAGLPDERQPPRSPTLSLRTAPSSLRSAENALAALPRAALDLDDQPVELSRQSRRSRRALLAVGTATVLALLLLDVHVEVGRTPASAEEATSTPPARSRQLPVGPGPASSGTGAVTGVTSRRFAWAPSAGAESYLVQLFRGAERVFSATAATPAITIPARWRYEGKQGSLVPGEYRWYVWPIVDGRRAQAAVVQAKLTVP